MQNLAGVRVQEGQRNAVDGRDDVVSMLPKLRLAARQIVPDPAAADHLVERTLEGAVAQARAKPRGLSLADWLNEIMERVLANEGADLPQ